MPETSSIWTPLVLRQNLFSGLTVALAMIPEAIAFSFVAGVDPLVGLYAAFFMCLITASFGGRPGMISGATGALAVVMVALVAEHGVEYLFAAVILMGLLQLLFGVMRLGKFIRLVPHPVMLGFVNGLAIVILLSQLESFKDGHEWIAGNQLWTMIGLTAVSVALIFGLPRINKNLPAPLITIAVVALAATFLGLDARSVSDLSTIKGGFPIPSIPIVPFNFETLRIIFPYSLILAAIGLIETLLTLNLVDEITDTVGRPNKESLAQGAGNIVTGFFGGMGGCAMIGQSMINVDNGGRRRLSGIIAAVALIASIMFLSDIIGLIPLAALVGLMVVVSYKTFAWASLGRLNKVPKEDAFVIIAVTAVTVATDLATAVVIGVAIAGLVFAWKHAKEIRIETRDSEEGRTYEVQGTVFFASTSQFAAAFSPRDDPDNVIIEFRHARVMDHSAIEAIEALVARYAARGKQVRLRHLSRDCRALLDKARSTVEIDPEHDPRYHPAVDHLADRLSEA
jgi:SulP family sulfate permease